MVQVEGPPVPRQCVYVVEAPWVVVVQGSIAHLGQARWTGNSPEYFVKAVAAAAAGAHDPLADSRTNRLRYHGEVVAEPAFSFAPLVHHDQVARMGSPAAAAGAHDPLADSRTNRLRHHGEVVAGPAFAFASLVLHDQVARTGSRHQHVHNLAGSHP